MRKLALGLVINAAALWAASEFVSGVSLTGGAAEVLAVALIFGLVNLLIRPVVKFLSFPVILLSLGLFTFVINGAMLWLTSAFTPYLQVQGLVPAILGSIVISLTSLALSWFLSEGGKKKH